MLLMARAIVSVHPECEKAVAGNFFVSYQQGIEDEVYINAFLNQLRKVGVSYRLVRKMPVDVEMIKEKVRKDR